MRYRLALCASVLALAGSLAVAQAETITNPSSGRSMAAPSSLSTMHWLVSDIYKADVYDNAEDKIGVVTDLIGEQVPVVGGQDDRLDTQVAEHPHPPSQVAEHAVHLESRLSDVAGLAELVDLLRGDEHEPGGLHSLLDPLGGLGQ